MSQLSKICSYYLECLAKDMDHGVWAYTSSNYNSYDYGQLSKLPFNENDAQDIYEQKDVLQIISKVRHDKNRQILMLGYPVAISKKTARKTGNPYYTAEPLFLFPYDTDSFIHGGLPKLAEEPPLLNSEAVKNLGDLTGGDLFHELISISDELGLNLPMDEQPEIGELMNKIKALKPEWNWKEDLNIDSISTTHISGICEPGIWNNGALFYSERSMYTQGLEKELYDLKEINEGQWLGTILGKMLTSSFDESDFAEDALIEPLPLNDEQRLAVQRSLHKPLTVVTGPPGTGKSQVVTAILLNAIYRGQKVLFASKNHKAVDVVYERFNGLTNTPVMIRVGNTSLQAKVSQQLSGFLSSNIAKDDTEIFEHLKKKYDNIITKYDENKGLINSTLVLRNRLSEMEAKLENSKHFLNANKMEAIKRLDDNSFNKIKLLVSSLGVALNDFNFALQPFQLKLIWIFIKNNRRIRIIDFYSKLEKWLDLLSIKSLEQPVETVNLKYHYEYLKQLNAAFQITQDAKAYFDLMHSIHTSKSFFELSKNDQLIVEQISEISHALWAQWIKILPSRFSPEARRLLGEYVALLNLIVQADSSNTQAGNRIWAQYYKLLPRIASILTCWAVTSLSVRSKIPFEPSYFDLVVIDEASQCDIASAVPLLYRAKRAVIIGDAKQLQHISQISHAQDIEMLGKNDLEKDFLAWSYSSNSLFNLAQSRCHTGDVVVLKDHHRSHADIISFSNKYFYDGDLRIATKYENLKFLTEKEPVVRWEHIKGAVTSPQSGGSLNVKEAQRVFEELKRIKASGYKGTIGVVSPFRAQANRIRGLINADNMLNDSLLANDFLVDTVHKFQGDERDVMIFSPVISTGISPGSIRFLSRTGNLFNVAITRARAGLIIIGDKDECAVSEIDYIKKFVAHLNSLDQPQEKVQQKGIIDYGLEYPKVSPTAVVSDWEKYLYKRLYECGIKTMPQYQVAQYCLDLALKIGERTLDIEVDGEKYHRGWNGELCRRDQLRNKRLIELGWDVQRFWVYEIRDDIEGCICRVKDWINLN